MYTIMSQELHGAMSDLAEEMRDHKAKNGNLNYDPLGWAAALSINAGTVAAIAIDIKNVERFGRRPSVNLIPYRDALLDTAATAMLAIEHLDSLAEEEGADDE